MRLRHHDVTISERGEIHSRVVVRITERSELTKLMEQQCPNRHLQQVSQQQYCHYGYEHH